MEPEAKKLVTKFTSDVHGEIVLEVTYHLEPQFLVFDYVNDICFDSVCQNGEPIAISDDDFERLWCIVTKHEKTLAAQPKAVSENKTQNQN